MADYAFLLQNAATRDTVNVVNPRSASMTFDLFETETASFTMSAYDPAAQFLSEAGATDLVIVRNSTPIYRGRILDVRRDINASTISCGSDGYKYLLDQQLIYPVDITSGFRTYTNIDATVIAASLINLVQARANNNLYITVAANNTTALRTRTYPAGYSIGEAIDKLGRVQQDDTGADVFEWWLEPTLTGSIFHTFSPSRGKNNPSYALSYGGTVSSATVDVDSRDAANVLIIAGTGGLNMQMLFSSDYDSDDSGARAVYIEEASLKTVAAVLERGRFLMANQVGITIPNFTFHLYPGAWDGPSDMWIGDLVSIDIDQPGYSVQRSDLRCTGIGLAVDDNGIETVTTSIGKRKRTTLEAISGLTRAANYVLAQRNRAFDLGNMATRAHTDKKYALEKQLRTQAALAAARAAAMTKKEAL